jgi:hypothetical protein
MKRVYTILIMLLAVFSLYGQDIVGDWIGAITAESPEGMTVTRRIVFHINAADNGYTSTFDSPDQNAFGYVTDSTTYEDKELTITVEEHDFVYTGKLSDAKTIDGSLTQRGMTFDLDLTRKEE